MRTAEISTLYRTLPQLQSLQKTQNAQQEQLATGRKINRLQDDPVTAHELLGSRVERESLVQLRKNSIAAEGIANAGLEAMNYLKSLADQALAVVNDPSTRNATGAKQIGQLINDAISMANSRHQGEYVFAGASTEAPFAIDEATGEIIYSGDGAGRSFDVAESAALSPFAPSETVGAIHQFLGELRSLQDALVAQDNQAIDGIVSGINSSEDAMVEGAADLSFKLMRIESLQARDAAKYSTLDQRETEALAVDTTEVVVNLLNSQKAYQAALQSMASVNKLTLLNYM